MSEHVTNEEECTAIIIPLFSTNVLPQGKFVLPNGIQLVCFTRARHLHDSVPQDSLFVDDVWPGSRVLADFVVDNEVEIAGKYCLELGAGAALPSLVAASLGATRVIISDYPADGVIDNIRDVISANKLDNAHAVGHIWGKENIEALRELGSADVHGEKQGYDIIFLAELLWKDTYSSHRSLLESISLCLRKDSGVAYMTLAHRPTPDALDHTQCKDLEFFTLALSDFGLISTKLQTCTKYNDVSESTPIDVHLYSLRFVSTS